MAVVNKPKPRELCPECYQQGVEEDLVYQPGSQFTHFCNRGHRWEDRDVLAAALLSMNRARRAAKAASPEPTPEPPPPPSQPVDTRMRLEDIDVARLQSILGSFTDSSSLFGAVFALNEQKKDADESLVRAKSAAAAGLIHKLPGDTQINVMIPERHVQPLKDVAESGGMSLERYVNARLEDALDNLWFY